MPWTFTTKTVARAEKRTGDHFLSNRMRSSLGHNGRHANDDDDYSFYDSRGINYRLFVLL